MSLLSIFGFGRKSTRTVIKQISVHQAHDLTSTGALTLIDVRKPGEWNETGRPKGSHGITLQGPDFEMKILQIISNDKTQPLAFTCHTGGRSSMAADKAKAAGFTDISNVEGGFLAWARAALPIDKGPF